MSRLVSWETGQILLPYLALVSIHLLSGMQMEQPIVLADEMGYLGNARYLSGVGHLPNMKYCNFYQFGYSLALLPAFWLFTEPVSIYKAAVTINAFLASSLYFSLYFMLTSFFEVPRSTARWIAFACCLYPALILYSSFAMSENAFVPVFAAVTALFGRFLGSGSSRDALLFGFSAGFLYTIHPRALPAVAMIMAYLFALTFLRILRWSQFFLSATAMGVVFVLTRIVNEHLKAIGWESSGEFSAAKLAGRLLPGSHFPALVDRALGQILYLAQASHGLFLVGLAALAWLVVRSLARESPRRIMADPKTGVAIFLFIAAAGVFFASCTSTVYSIHGPDGVQGANLIHGRHNEAFAVLFIAFALVEFCRERMKGRQLVWRALGVAAALLFLSAVVMIEVDDARVRHVAGLPGVAPAEAILPSDVDTVNVAGVYPLVGMVGALELYSMSLAVLASLLMILMAMRVSWRAGIVILMLGFTCFSLYNHYDYLLPAKEAAKPRLAFALQASRLGRIEAVSYDMAHRDPRLLYGAQYLLPHTVFNLFNSHRGEEPKSEAVISGNDWAQASRLGARFVVSSGTGNHALWVLPGELESRMSVVSYDDETFGAMPAFGIQESGFHASKVFQNAPGRWTSGAATLRVPIDPMRPPRILGIETMAPGRDGVDLQVLANGTQVWNRRVPAHVWSKTFSLEQVALEGELVIELKCDTFSPGQGSKGSRDPRRLGVVVRGIRLTSRDRVVARVTEGMTLGVEPVFGIEESGFYRPEQINDRAARWTDGAATLRVPLDPRNLPRVLEIETVIPSREGARLQIFANGMELWDERIPSETWSKKLSLEQTRLGDELLIELKSDTFSPAQSVERSNDRRTLGVMVRGLRLTTFESSESKR